MDQTTATSATRFRRWLWDGAKVVVAMLSIVAIAWFIGFYGAEGEVDEVRADIVDLGFGPKPSTQRFADALEDLGHDSPQVYSLNGNVIYFSVNYREGRPMQVLERYQQAFVDAGLNDQVYTSLDGDDVASHARTTTALTGGIVPQIISPNHITMGGVLTRGGAKDEEALLEEYEVGKNEAEMFKAHRYIEIYREADSGTTTVIATWSAEDFDYAKMVPGASSGLGTKPNSDHGVNVDVPACPGCTRVNQFDDIKTSPSPHQSSIYTTSMSPAQMHSFYRRAMSARGWTYRDNPVFDRLESVVDLGLDGMRSLQFTRDHQLTSDKQSLQITIYPIDRRQTAVRTVLTTEDQAEDLP